MSKIMELASELDNEYTILLAEVAKDKDDLANLKKVVTDKKKALDVREAELSTKELAYQKLANEVESKMSKVRTDAQIQAQYSEAFGLKEKADKELKQALDNQTEADLKLTWVSDREKAVSVQEATYQERIEKRISEKFRTLLK